MSNDLRCSRGHHWRETDANRIEVGRAIACPTCGSPPTLESLGAPAEVVAAMRELLAELPRQAGANLAAVVLYGGLARGRYRPGKSDVNLLVALRDVTQNSLTAIAAPLHRAWRAAAVEPFIVAPDELAATAQVFASKLLDIRDHHIVLLGDNVLADLDIPRESLRLRVEQSLRNMCLRLRRRWLPIVSDARSQSRVLAEIARPLALELAALLRLSGKTLPADDRTAVILQQAVRDLGLNAAIVQLADLRQGKPPAGESLSELYGIVLRDLEQAAAAAIRLKEATA